MFFVHWKELQRQSGKSYVEWKRQSFGWEKGILMAFFGDRDEDRAADDSSKDAHVIFTRGTNHEMLRAFYGSLG